jgi:hypothetical protein
MNNKINKKGRYLMNASPTQDHSQETQQDSEQDKVTPLHGQKNNPGQDAIINHSN